MTVKANNYSYVVNSPQAHYESPWSPGTPLLQLHPWWKHLHSHPLSSRDCRDALRREGREMFTWDKVMSNHMQPHKPHVTTLTLCLHHKTIQKSLLLRKNWYHNTLTLSHSIQMTFHAIPCCGTIILMIKQNNNLQLF